MLKCVMLDLGNTLVDFHDREKIAKAFHKVFCRHGYRADLDFVSRYRESVATRYHKENYPHPRRHYMWPVVQRVLKKMGYEVSRAESRELSKEIQEETFRFYRLFPGVREVLAAVNKKGLKTALICNGTTEWVEAQMEKFGIEKYFDVAVVSEEVGKEKSGLEPFRIALRKLKVKPEECIMVGDRTDEDMKAKELGILTCHAAYGSELSPLGDQTEPDFRITDIRQLLDIIDDLKN